LCHASIATDAKYFNSRVIGYSEFSQTNINKRTNEYYDTYGFIPMPHELDDDFKLVIDVNAYFYIMFEHKIKNFIIFFTGEIEKYMDDEISSSFKILNKKPLMNYFKYDHHKSSEDEIIHIAQNMNSVKIKNSEIMKDIRTSLNQKYSRA
jgi:hypothetical protein